VRGPLLVISNHISDVDFSFVQAALPARIRHKLAIATRARRWNCCARRSGSRMVRPDLRPRAVDAWGCAAELVSAAASGRVPQKLCLRRRSRRSWLQRPRLPRRKAHARRQSQLVPLRSWPAGQQSAHSRASMRIDGLFELKKAGKRFAAPGTIRCALASRCSLRRKPIRRRLLGRCRRRLRSSKRRPGKARDLCGGGIPPRGNSD